MSLDHVLLFCFRIPFEVARVPRRWKTETKEIEGTVSGETFRDKVRVLPLCLCCSLVDYCCDDLAVFSDKYTVFFCFTWGFLLLAVIMAEAD